MPGKCDQTSHDAAIARVAAALPHASFIRRHLADILNSDTFKGSKRSQEFLTHVVECALAGQWERLKERSLGIDVFHRDPDYDTGGDSIVRVTASDVRKRLLQFYSECSSTHGFRIEIPAGSYIPTFTGLQDAVEPAEPVEAARIPAVAAPAPHRVPARKAIWLVLAVCCGWAMGLLSPRFVSGSSVQPESRYEFYREMLGPIATDPAHETEIALSNPRLWPTPAGQDYTETGDAISAFNLSQLMRSLGRSAHLTESRFLNWGSMRNAHLILVGAAQMIAWTEESLERANFTMASDAIANAQPQAGERQTYGRSVNGNILEDYGLIWMARSPSGSRRLLMAGLTSAGTAGASEFFCDPDRMGTIYNQLRSASPKGLMVAEWQVLLRIHARDNVPLRIDLVSLRAGRMSAH